MFSPFRLLELPLLALEHVIQLLDVSEMVFFSFCSQKAFILIQQFRDKSLDLKLVLDGEAKSISLMVGQELRTEVCVRDAYIAMDPVELVRIGRTIVKMEQYYARKGCFFYWDDKILGLKIVAEYFSKLFKIDVSEVKITKSQFWMLDYTQNRQNGEKGKFTVSVVPFFRELTDEQFRLILRSNRVNRLNLLESPKSNNFLVEDYRTSIDYFFMKKGSWITIDNIITMDCLEYSIEDEKKFTNQELNRFLKHWIAGGAQRLKFMSVSILGLATMEMFADIMGNVKRTPREFHFKRRFDDPWKFDIEQSIIVKSEDGRVASFQHMMPKNIFVIGVWPDIEGNDLEIH